MTVTANYLVTVSREMGQAMQNTAYSPIFNEALDFSCAVFDEEGEMIGQGEFCPAQLGATTMALRWIIDEFGLDALEPGDVFLHNDPYSGMNHLPEHMVVKAVFCDGQRVGIVACIGHMAEVGGLAPGGFPGDAREVFHEGLRIPPVKIVKAGVEDARSVAARPRQRSHSARHGRRPARDDRLTQRRRATTPRARATTRNQSLPGDQG